MNTLRGEILTSPYCLRDFIRLPSHPSIHANKDNDFTAYRPLINLLLTETQNLTSSTKLLVHRS